MVEQRVVAVERDQRGGFEFGELTDEFGADGATGAGDEHATSGDEGSHGGGVDVDDAAIQDVFVAVPRELPGASFSDQALHRRHDECLEAGGVHDCVQSAELDARCRRHGEQHGSGAVLGGEALEVGGGALDSQRGDAPMAHGRVVVDQRNRAVRAGADRVHRGDRPVAAVAGAVHDDGHLVEIGRRGEALGANPPKVAMAEHQADGERRREHQDLSGSTAVGDDELDGDQQRAHRASGDRDRSGLVEAEALEVTSVEPGGVPDGELRSDGDRSQRRCGCLERVASVETRGDGECQRPDQQVSSDDNCPRDARRAGNRRSSLPRLVPNVMLHFRLALLTVREVSEPARYLTTPRE